MRPIARAFVCTHWPLWFATKCLKMCNVRRQAWNAAWRTVRQTQRLHRLSRRPPLRGQPLRQNRVPRWLRKRLQSPPQRWKKQTTKKIRMRPKRAPALAFVWPIALPSIARHISSLLASASPGRNAVCHETSIRIRCRRICASLPHTPVRMPQSYRISHKWRYSFYILYRSKLIFTMPKTTEHGCTSPPLETDQTSTE